MSTKNIKQLIKAKGDNAFERAMRMYGIKPKEAEKIFKSTDWANVDNGGGSGGGGESASTIEYVSVEGKNLFEWGEALGITAFLVKMPTKIVPVALLTLMDETVNDAIAFALDPTMEFDFQGTRMTIADFLASGGVNLSTYNRLTKEQFYDLNA